jgi:hypothetical protein
MYLARKLPAPSSLLRRYKSTISHPDRFFCPRRSLSREMWPLIGLVVSAYLTQKVFILSLTISVPKLFAFRYLFAADTWAKIE